MTKKRILTQNTELVSYGQLAELLGVSPSQVFALARRGYLPLKKINLGGCVRFDRKKAEEWIRRGCPVGREGRAD